MKRKEIKKFVSELSPGVLTGEALTTAKSMLFDIWEELDRLDDSSMHISKLDRIENLSFESPSTITFIIERHGQTVMGSVYADIHKWYIYLDNMKAKCDSHYGKRVVHKKLEPLNVKPIAESIGNSILNNDKDNDYLEWINNKTVKVKISKIIPEVNKQTTAGRRKRFREALENIILSKGWKTTKVYNKYER